jgi:hypothetical protein
MTSNEKKMLYILCILLVIFVCLRTTWKEAGLNDLNKDISEIENAVKNLQVAKNVDADLKEKIKLIDTAIENEQKKFYKAGEIDIASFGLKVKDLITQNNLKIENQRTISQKDVEFIEFRCIGKSNQLANFLREISASEKYFRVDSLTIQSKNIDGNIDAKMRITYETITADNN